MLIPLPPPQTFVEISWLGLPRSLALAIQGGFVLFWDPTSPQFQREPHEWVFAVEWNASYPDRAQVSTDFLVRVFKEAHQSQRVGRMMHWDGDRCVFLMPGGVGTVSRQTTSGRPVASTEFSTGNGKDIFVCPASYWNERLQDCTHEPESDFAFALGWRAKSDLEQVQCLMQLCWGSWDEMGQIAQLILSLEGHDFFVPDSYMHSAVHAQLRYREGNVALSVDGEDEDFFTQRGELWGEWLQFFEPVINDEMQVRHLAAKRAAERGFDWGYVCVAVALTQHEQLETRLHLRDWLSERVGLCRERITEILA